jgi:hypothetical protein
MRLRTVPVRIAAAIAAVSLSAAAAHAGAWLPRPGEYYSEFTASRSVSDTYYDSEGTRYVRPFGAFEETRDLRLYNELGWRERASLVLSVPIRSRTRSVGADYGYGQLTATGLGDLDLGVRIRVKDGTTAIAAQLDWNAPLGYEHDLADSSSAPAGLERVAAPNLGTGRQSLQGALLVGQALPAWNSFLEAGGGYRMEPQDGGASEWFGSATAGVWLGSSLLVSGCYSMVRSATAFEGERDQLYALGSRLPAGTEPEYDFQTVNPQLLYRVDDRLDVFVGSVHTASGQNRPHFDSVYVGMAFKQTRLNRLQGFLGGKRRP